ncbi:MAG: bifunctional nuclease family protein [Candidatus Obscuribacterales bacterium]|nr:bifunctional nuclease family protein [Candidatus Obscuribacterales bacterium]
MLKMFVSKIAVSSHTGLPIVILREDTERRALAITVGQQEAVNISRAMSRIKPPRPRPLDLIMSFAAATGYALQEVSIHPYDEDSYCATITMVNERGTIQQLDARPSDAIALAVGNAAPIFVENEITVELRHRQKTLPDKDFSKFVEKIKASDFARLGVSTLSTEESEKTEDTGD